MHTWGAEALLPLRLLLLLLCPGVEGPAGSPAGARHTHSMSPNSTESRLNPTDTYGAWRRQLPASGLECETPAAK
jgi:hypothetical protein